MKPTMTDREKYDLLMQAARTAPKGKLLQTAAALLGTSSENTVRTFIRRLESRGYNLAEWHAAGKAVNAPGDKDEEQYAQLMQAAQTAKPGHLIRIAQELTGLSEGGLQAARLRMESRGYDFNAWHFAAAQGLNASRQRQHAPPVRAVKPPVAKAPAPAPTAPATLPDHVETRRAKWLADMRAVADDPAPVEQLCERWGCSRDVVNGRAGVLRNAGHDLTWWRPSRGFAIEKPPVKAEQVRTLSSPVAPAPKRQKRQIWAAEVPYTMQSIADIVGMPVMAVRFAARAHGIGFDRWCLPPDVAIALLAALGFERAVAA
jgi:biotin operon repressor